jgi:tetratricopeptide (TPR) repeat protein
MLLRISIKVFLLILGWGSKVKTVDNTLSLKEINFLIDAWKIEEANSILNKISKSQKSPRINFLMAKARFYNGKYKEALKYIKLALNSNPYHEEWKQLKDIISFTLSFTDNFKERLSKHKHFKIRVPSGDEEILLFYADKVLEKIYDKISKDLGYVPSSPVIVEFYPDLRSFASATGISPKRIRQTGMVAISMFNRLILISPKALNRGYPWLDILCHEYIHLVVTKKTYARAPVWFQEGLAKLREKGWNASSPKKLKKPEWALLIQAFKRKKLIPFFKIKRSFLELSSQSSILLASVQAHSLVLFIYEKIGWKGIRAILDMLEQGISFKEAVRKTMSYPLFYILKLWHKELSKKRVKVRPYFLYSRFKRTDELDEIKLLKVRDYVYLGDVLKTKGRYKAALLEYKKAFALGKSLNPIIANKIASLEILLNRYRSAISILTPVVRLYPDYPYIYLNLATAHIRSRNFKKAKEYLLKANSLIPFHPKVHCTLEKIYTQKGELKQGKIEARHCKILKTSQGAVF